MAGVTLKTLAELSGLSIRTVNRALKNQPEISEENRRLVRRLAAEYHYMPDMAARNFRLRRRNMVGILMRDRIAHEAQLQKIAELERRLIGANCYPVLGCALDRDPKRILQEWNGVVGSVVSFCSPATDDFGGVLASDPLSFIFLDCENPDPRCHSISIDRAAGIAEAYRAMIDAGCRRILHCGSLAMRIEAVRRITEGELAGQAEFLHLPGESDPDAGYRCARRIVASGCDAVFFDTDRMATGFYRYAQEHRISIPDKISVIGFDDDAVARCLPPPLSSIAHPVEEIGRAVLEIIADHPESPVHRRFPTRFLPRASLLARPR